MKYEYYEKYINKKTTGRMDATPLFGDPIVFWNLLKDLIKPFKKIKINKIAGLDALGFIIGWALAQKEKVGFIPIRKWGKLPGIPSTLLKTSFTDYTKTVKSFEINKSAIKKGDKVLLVDEWIETGSQIKSAIILVEKLGGKVIGIATICADKSKQTKILFDTYNLKAIKINNIL